MKNNVLYELNAAVRSAFGRENLDDLARAVWIAHGHGSLTDREAQTLAESIHSRRMPAKATRKAQDGRGLNLAAGAHEYKNSRNCRSNAKQRRRRLAFSGPLPPALAARFTVAELAALRIVADDYRARGRCDACMDEIAARAGISKSSAKNAVREAVRLGLLARRERRYRDRRSETNVLTVISAEWLTWLAKGRGQKSDRHGYRIKNHSQVIAPQKAVGSEEEGHRPMAFTFRSCQGEAPDRRRSKCPHPMRSDELKFPRMDKELRPEPAGAEAGTQP